ncbi:MAG: hypothetical protein RL264_1729 [Bacteroidota bacterium]|jgi:single-strand DNA-binding protein
MSTHRNKVSLIGRLGAKPELVKFESGYTLARFSIAVNERYKDKNGEQKETTNWYNINAWGKGAEIASKILDKGNEIFLEGRLVNQNYETKAGEKRYSTIVEMTDFMMVQRPELKN